LVIELQNSAISLAEIQARERFYGNMVWIVNAGRFAQRFFLLRRMGPELLAFKWKHLKPSWRFARKPVYLDFGTLTVSDLLGGRFVDPRAFYSKDGEYNSFRNVQVARFTGDNAARPDASLATLPPDVLSCTALQLNTIHDGGCGSAKPLPQQELRRRLGL